jgi:hypothetical protein
MLIAERIFGNFFDTSNTAVATCCEPPKIMLPDCITSFPDLTNLPEIPSISLIFFGLLLEKTKLV